MSVQSRIVIADDHPLVRGALRQAVEGAVANAIIIECGDLDELSRELDANGDADLVLLDLAMPGVRGFSGLMYLRAQHPQAPVAVVSANEDRGVMRRCIDFGACGFIPKTTPMETMREAIRCVLGFPFREGLEMIVNAAPSTRISASPCSPSSQRKDADVGVASSEHLSPGRSGASSKSGK